MQAGILTTHQHRAMTLVCDSISRQWLSDFRLVFFQYGKTINRIWSCLITPQNVIALELLIQGHLYLQSKHYIPDEAIVCLFDAMFKLRERFSG